MHLANVLILVAWTIFFGFWLWKWRDSKPTAQQRNLAGRAAYMVPTVIGVLLIEFGLSKPAPHYSFGARLWPASLSTQWIALAVVVAGLLVAIWARVVLASNWSAHVEVKKEHELLTSGPYAWVRHPIYTGMLMMLAGSAFAVGTGSALLGLALVGVGFVIKLRQEEELMRGQFAGAYADYAHRVKCLIPFVW